MSPDTAVIIPCYKRPDYTIKCIQSVEKSKDLDRAEFFLLDDGSNDGTDIILKQSSLPIRSLTFNKENFGLRTAVIDFFEKVSGYKYLAKIDNDCTVPEKWLSDCIKYLEEDKADIVSPNVYPSNAAFKLGKEDSGDGLRMSKLVGGLWVMKESLLDDMKFERINAKGIRGAFSILNQIIIEKEPRIGWASKVTVQDLGHYSGAHPEHIKSEEHLEYSLEVGRNVSWG